VSIFGSGLSGAGRATTVELGGVAMEVLFATPFQINAVVPAVAGVHIECQLPVRDIATTGTGFGGGSGNLSGEQSAGGRDHQCELWINRPI